MKRNLKINRKSYETIFSFRIEGTNVILDVPTPPIPVPTPAPTPAPTPPPTPVPTPVNPPNPFPPLLPPISGWPPGITPPPVVPTAPGLRQWRQVVLKTSFSGVLSIASGDGHVTAYNEDQIPAINAWMDHQNNLWQVGVNFPGNPGDCGAEIRGGPGLFTNWSESEVVLGMYPVENFARQVSEVWERIGYYGYRFDEGKTYPTWFLVPGSDINTINNIFRYEGYYLEMTGPTIWA